ncbi:UDP-N-acetylglucosamine 2-epimerase (non-hydrolyzing) [Akkermansiaceae bacterium]|nr:UDP-N-acetylglucosamine 2-epimerase (non-hydrolyzing) [Akkermansiaceae bacterium]
MPKKRISVIFGTRPEAIKLAPIILALKDHDSFDCHVCVTAQHREMLDQVLSVFQIEPDFDLNLMKPNQSLAHLTANAVIGLNDYLESYQPDLVLVQGDTTTVFAASLAAFYQHIPVGHVEAGLRTGNMSSPWPEEGNRVLTSRLAKLHFAPTETSRQNLLREGVEDESIVVTGNTVIDALFNALDKVMKNPPPVAGVPDFLQPQSYYQSGEKSRIVLVTGHRRENFGEGFEMICQSISRLATCFPDVHFVYPVHLNPNVREPAKRILGDHHGANVHLIEPLDYLPFVALMNMSYLILTDSGGVQEEAPSLGKPVLVMRDTTERPEAVEAGTVRLVGTNDDAIVSATSELLEADALYERMASAHNPYGDGKATGRHIRVLELI